MTSYLIVILVVLLIVTLPFHRHSRKWGYFPSSLLGLMLLAVILFAWLGRV